MLRKYLDLFVIVAIALLNVAWLLLSHDVSLISIMLVLPLVFVCPGYTLSEVLFHKRSLKTAQRILFTLGLSITIVVLAGFILNLFPIGLQATSWTALLVLITVVFSLLAAFLRRGVRVGPRQAVHLRLGLYPGILFGLAIVLTILAIAYSAFGAARQQYPGFTQLWILPENSTGKSCAIRLGVHSYESTSERYRLTMTANGDAVMTLSSLSLGPQQEWTRLVPLTPETTKNVFVEAQLYRLDKPGSVYQKVNVTLYSCPTSRSTPSPSLALASASNGARYDMPTKGKTNMRRDGRDISGHFTAGAGSPNGALEADGT